MNKISFNLLLTLMGAFMMLFVASCDKDDDPEPQISKKPVYQENFDYTIDGNSVTFTTTLSGNVWFRNVTAETDHNVVDGSVVVSIPLKGSYPFTCNILADGETSTSSEFTVEIENDDLSFLEEGFWKNLTGGVEGGKKWRLDNFMSDGGNQYNKYFDTVLKYYGFTGDGDDESWNNGGHNLFVGDWTNWAEHSPEVFGPEIGTISFNGATMTAKLNMEEGIDLSTKEVASYEVESAVSIDIQEEAYGYKTELESLYGLTFSDKWAKVKFTAPVRMPFDKGRVKVGEFTSEGDGSLYNISIISCTDSALVVAVERIYEADGSEAHARLLYNYVCDDYTYDYDDPDLFVAPERPATSGSLENGTYKLAEIPGYYYSWTASSLTDTWEAVDAYKKNMAEWWSLGDPSETLKDGEFTVEGQARWDAAYGAYTSQTIIVDGNNITVNYKGINVWGDAPTALIENTVATTFTVDNGVITLADPISVYTPNAGFDNVVELYIMPEVFSTGIAIGHDDINKEEKKYQSKLQNWIKE